MSDEMLSDARILAKAILDNWQELNETNSRNSYAECRYCDAHTILDWQDQEGSFQKIKHEPGCPVRVAKDLMTGSEVATT